MTYYRKMIAGMALALGTALIAPSAAVAGGGTMAIDADGRRTIPVSYADLDLSSTAGQDMLNSRIRAAARKVCRDDRSSRGGYLEQTCRRNAMRASQPQVFAAIAGARDTQLAMSTSRR